MSRFAYRERSAETVSNRAKQSGGGYDSYINSALSFVKVKEGQNDYRIMPPTWDVDGPFGDNWGIEVYVHRDVGPDNNVYLCLDEMRKKYTKAVVPTKLGNCPLCAMRHEVDEADEKLIKQLKAGKQIITYIINRDAEKDGPQVWRLGWKLERDIQILSQDKSGKVLPIDHPDRGYDISFTRTGQGLKTDYSAVRVARDESPLSEKEAKQDKWLDYITDHPLTEQLVFFDADYIETVYRGKKSGGKQDADEEVDDRPTRSRRPAEDDDTAEDRPKRRSRDEEEVAEDQPRRRRSAEPDEVDDRPRRRARDDDDELPGDDQMARNAAKAKKAAVEEDEDDEPAPRRRSADQDDADDDRPRRRPARDEDDDESAPRKRASRDIDEDDATPAPRAKSAKRAAADEDDDADAEEDDDPKPRGKASDRAKESLNRLKSTKR